jgi:hypothetical protein
VTGRRVRIAGWVFDEGGPLDRVLAVVGDLPPVTLTVGAWRADIAATFAHIPHAGASGFKCDVDLRSTPSGSISVALLARRRTGQWQPVTEYNVTVIAPVEDRGPRRAAAAFTIAQNEPLMLPLWVDYYRRYFDADDLYVLDHDSTDESVRRVADRCHVVPVHRAMSFDHRWLRGTVESFQSFLLSSYETVLFAEVDEFVIADPRRYGGLGDYIARLRHLAVRCAGFNVVHQPDEPPIRLACLARVLEAADRARAAGLVGGLSRGVQRAGPSARSGVDARPPPSRRLRPLPRPSPLFGEPELERRGHRSWRRPAEPDRRRRGVLALVPSRPGPGRST